MPTGSINPDYGNASATAPDWSEIDRRLADAPLYWLATTRSDGRPHAVPVCGVWRDGAFHFCTGQEEQKMRNLEHDPHVSVLAGHLGVHGWGEGKDISVEGVASRITDDALLEALATAWHDKYGDDWVYVVRDHAFVEDRPGAGAAHVFRVPPEKVLVFGDDHGQTRYRFNRES